MEMQRSIADKVIIIFDNWLLHNIASALRGNHLYLEDEVSNDIYPDDVVDFEVQRTSAGHLASRGFHYRDQFSIHNFSN